MHTGIEAWPVDDADAHVEKKLFHHKPPSPWGALGMVLLYFLLQLLAGFAIGVAAGIWLGATQAAHSGHAADPAATVKLIHGPAFAAWSTVIGLAFAAAAMTWIIRRRWPDLWPVKGPPRFGLAEPENVRYFFQAALAGVVVAALGSALTRAFAQGQAWHQDLGTIAGGATIGVRILLAISVVCVAPWAEELLFRGVLLSALMRRMQTGWAVIFAALAFACVHLPDFKFAWYAIPTLALLGFVCGWLRVASRSLWPAIAAHATNNLVAVLGWFLIARPHG